MAGTSEAYVPMAFVAALGVGIWHEDGRTRGSLELHTSMWAEGTSRPRLGILAILADLVLSSPPSGMLAPTIDLRVELLRDLPPGGRLEAVATMLKVGRRLAVGEVWIDVDGQRSARATGTLVVPPGGPESRHPSLATAFAPRPNLPERPRSFEALIGATHPAPNTTVVAPTPEIRNGPGDTVQGGIQAMIAEVAAEAALGGSRQWSAVDADVRFPREVRAGPVLASSEVVAHNDAAASVRVTLRDLTDTNPERLVAYASIRCRRHQRGGAQLGARG